jgi:hypothetical protein
MEDLEAVELLNGKAVAGCIDELDTWRHKT